MGKLSTDFFLHFAADIVFTFILIRFIYYPVYRNRERIFIYIIFNVMLFLLMSTMNQVDVSIGATFGMFAVFSILRYRTELITPRDLTYLFIIITTSLLNAIINSSWYIILSINLLILVMTYLIEGSLFRDKTVYRSVKYDRPELLYATDQNELRNDLEKRMGISIRRITIGKYDFYRESVQINVYYNE